MRGTDTRFDSILFVCLLAIVANPRLGDGVPWLKEHANSLAMGGTFLIILCFAWLNPFFRDTVRYTLLGAGLTPKFFLVTLPQEHWLTRCLEWSVLRWLGQRSYTMYLIHHTLFHHFYHFHRPSLWLAMGVLGMTMLYAQAMRSMIELPIQEARRCLGAKARIPDSRPISKPPRAGDPEGQGKEQASTIAA